MTLSPAAEASVDLWLKVFADPVSVVDDEWPLVSGLVGPRHRLGMEAAGGLTTCLTAGCWGAAAAAKN